MVAGPASADQYRNS